MKNLIYLFITSILVSVNASGQIFTVDKLKKRIQNRAEQKTEQKVNEKVDNGVDKVLDGIFGGIEKGAKSATSEKGSDSSKTSEPTPEQSIGLFNKMLGGGGVPPESSYDFQSSYDIKMSFTEKSKLNSMTARYFFATDAATMSMKMLDASDPDMKKSLEMVEMMIFDFEKSSMYNFMNMNGQKTIMSIGFKNGATGELASEGYEKTTYTKTSQKKTIVGYTCTGYKMQQEKEEYLVWISDQSIPFIKGYYEAFNRMSKNTPNQKQTFAYDTHPEIYAMVKNGQMMLGMDKTDKKGDFTGMEVVKINPNDKFTFNTEGYSNMMDMNKIMRQAEEKKN